MGDDLYELPEGWVWSTVNEIIQIIDYRGRTPPFSEDGIPHLRSSNIKSRKIIWQGLAFVSEETYQQYMTRGLPQKGDVLFTTEAPLGEVALAPALKFSLAQRMIILRPNGTVLLPRFLLYQIASEEFQGKLRGKGTGTTVKGISSRNFKPFKILVAPLPEQHRIVTKIEELFTQLDAGVELLKKLKAKLKRYRQAVLKAAVEGNLTKEWREANKSELEPASVLLERILKQRRKKWEAEQLAKMKANGKTPKDDRWKSKYKEPVAPDTSDLPELPDGWCWGTFEQASERVTVGHVGSMKGEYIEDGIPFLRSQNVRENRYEPEGLKFISPEFHTQ
ncbi:MAG: restriction endonuclease subunit S [Cyanobacteria bacterium J06633_8]